MTDDVRRRLWGYTLAVLIACAGMGLKFHQWYHSRTLWLDEEMVFLNIRDRMWSELAGPLWLNQSAPLGWLALQRGILQTFGTDDRAVRALSVAFGMATLLCALWVAIRWMKPAGAALFLLFCGLGQWMTYYALEAKPYAGDAFWALLLPALAVWVVEDPRVSSGVSLRRSWVWWIAATIGLWISYGAIFVAPACALLVCGVAWRRGDLRRALLVALQGIPWLVCFTAHYYLVMRHARASDFLADFWATGMPPSGASLTGILMWILQQGEPLASHPGGTSLWLIFWVTAAYGIAASFRDRPLLALSLLAVPLSACVFAVIGLVPLKDRLALWMLPAVYAAVALGADHAVHLFRTWLVQRRPHTLMLAVVAGLLVLAVTGDLVERGEANVLVGPDNHSLNDRSALRFLMVQRQPGDALVSTHDGLPAVWWYGGISIGGEVGGSRHPADGAPVLELRHEWPDDRGCRGVEPRVRLRTTLGDARRAAVYLGFGSRVPPGLSALVLDMFSEFSQLVAYRPVASEGIVALFDLGVQPDPSAIEATQALWRAARSTPPLAGCVNVRLAERW